MACHWYTAQLNWITVTVNARTFRLPSSHVRKLIIRNCPSEHLYLYTNHGPQQKPSPLLPLTSPATASRVATRTHPNFCSPPSSPRRWRPGTAASRGARRNGAPSSPPSSSASSASRAPSQYSSPTPSPLLPLHPPSSSPSIHLVTTTGHAYYPWIRDTPRLVWWLSCRELIRAWACCLHLPPFLGPMDELDTRAIRRSSDVLYQ